MDVAGERDTYIFKKIFQVIWVMIYEKICIRNLQIELVLRKCKRESKLLF